MKRIPVGTKHFALVDDTDFELVSPYRWYRFKRQRNRTAYAYRFLDADGNPANSHTGKTWQYMHQLITGYRQTDHKNGDGLDNRRANLRECSDTQNRSNTSKQRGNYSSQYKGVCWDKSRCNWKAKIQVNGRTINIGRFDSELEAAHAYDVAALKYFGEFAYTNGVCNSNLLPQKYR